MDPFSTPRPPTLDLLFSAPQGRGQPFGHGPYQHLQEGPTAGGAASRAVPGRAGSGGRASPGRPAWGSRVPVPVPLPPLELLQPQQGFWAHPAAGSVWGENLGGEVLSPRESEEGEQAWEGFRSPTSWPIYRHPGPPRGALHTVQIPISQGVSGLHSPQRHSLPRAGPRPQPPSVLRSDCPSLHPQTFGRRPSCLQLRQPAPATRSHRPVPWASCCSVAVRHPVGGPSPVLPACQAPPGLPGSQAPRRPAPPGSGEAAATTWTSGMKSQGCLWTRSTSAGVETSELWCNCTTTRLAGWCVPMGERTPVCEEWPRVHGAGMSEGV